MEDKGSTPASSEDKSKKKLSIKDLKRQLKECQKLKDEYLAGWQRSRADFLNYKREEMKRIAQLAKYASEGLILKILPVLDNFEIAEKNLAKDRKNDKNMRGLLQIKDQLKNFLKNQGVKEIKCLGEKFNPEFQEVIEEIKAEGKEPGTVVEEVKKGYKLHDKVLRPAKVKIAK